MGTAVTVRGLTKRFPGVVALGGVDFDLDYGEVHAIVGQNGAGKSTFVKVLNGIHRPDGGKIYVDGREAKIESPLDAKRLGITLVHQEVMIYPNLTVAENVYIGKLGVEGKTLGSLSRNRVVEEAKKYLELVGLSASPTAKVKDLGVGERQLVQIARALAENAKIICFDEPTSALTPAEVKRLFGVIKELKRMGKAIVYITHYIDELFEIADRVTVLRDGKRVATKSVAEVSGAEVVRLMLGRSLEEFYVRRERRASAARRVILAVRDLRTEPSTPTSVPLRGVSFELAEGEVLGVLGLLGAGKTELAKAILGVEKVVGGEILFEGRRVKIRGPRDAVRLGIFYLPEDRRLEGLVQTLSVRDNILLPVASKVSGIFRDFGKEDSLAEQYVRRLEIKTPSVRAKVSSLSGGNQQKVVVAKSLATGARVLIFDEPTMGIDVGAKVEIRRLISRLADEGAAVLLATSDVDEALALSDRILVLYKGKSVGFFENAGLDRETLLNLMSGVGKGG